MLDVTALPRFLPITCPPMSPAQASTLERLRLVGAGHFNFCEYGTQVRVPILRSVFTLMGRRT